MYNIMNNGPYLAVIAQWDKERHGIIPGEEKLCDYLSTKKLMCWDSHYYDSDTEDEMSVNTVEAEILEAVEFASGSEMRVAVIKRTYIYADRHFCVKNVGIELFQKLWREFHSHKIQHYKKIQNLLWRQRCGRFHPPVLKKRPNIK